MIVSDHYLWLVIIVGHRVLFIYINIHIYIY